MDFALRTETGKRQFNEDCGYIPCTKSDLPLIAISDGMGGHAAGEIASRMTIDVLIHALERSAHPVSSDALQNAIEHVNFNVFRAAQDNAAHKGMGATLVCALLTPASYVAANIGDSRLYHFNGKSLEQVTVDHSLVQMLLDKGSISKNEVKTHPRRNVITRAIGVYLSVDVDIFEQPWNYGDILLLCSDGLSGALEEHQLLAFLLADDSLDMIAKKMVDAALAAGSTDNITVALAKNVRGGCV